MLKNEHRHLNARKCIQEMLAEWALEIGTKEKEGTEEEEEDEEAVEGEDEEDGEDREDGDGED